MKQAEIKVGGYYVAKINGRLVVVHVTSHEPDPGYGSRRRRSSFRVRSLRTGYVTSMTAAKLRKPYPADKAQAYAAKYA